MTKYKICKFVDGAGEEWYQILKKGWIFWYYMCAYQGGAPEFSPLKVTIKFDHIEQAKKYIQDDIAYDNRGQIKKVGCFDYP